MSQDQTMQGIRGKAADAIRCQSTVLPSGLTVLCRTMPGYSTVHAIYATAFGSTTRRFTLDGKEVELPAGTAHFLEHKMFEDQEGDAFAKFARTGANANAFTSFDRTCYLFTATQQVDESLVRCPDPAVSAQMEELVARVKGEGDTVGGVITGVIRGVPVGLGEPVFGKLHAALGAAMLSINAVKGFEYGDGFAAALHRGTEINDIFYNDNGRIRTRTNHSGGIQGGISNGEDIVFRVAFKPVATLLREQPTVDIEGNETLLTARGRHDPCVLPRAVPIVESMAAMTILDYWLLRRSQL